MMLTSCCNTWVSPGTARCSGNSQTLHGLLKATGVHRIVHARAAAKVKCRSSTDTNLVVQRGHR
jgi:hypothetical protein